jgi:transcriptional regulator with XRE-family HTH domain
MISWRDRLKEVMKQRGFTQDALAAAIGVTQGSIGHYLRSDRQPTIEMIDDIANALNVSPIWILYGVTNTVEDKEVPVNIKFIPILQWEEITASSENLQETIDQVLKNKVKNQEILKMEIKDKELLGHRVAAVKAVNIDAMLPAYPHPRMILEGDYLIIDFDKKAKSGDSVLAFSQGSRIVRQYIEDGSKHLLKALNPQYPIIEIEYKDILAVIIKRFSEYD